MSQIFRSIFFKITPVVFIGILLLPLIFNFFDNYIDFEKGNEKRKMEELPKFDIDSLNILPKKFDAYYNDNFGLRITLVNMGIKIKYFLFNSSPKPEKVLIGKDGWLFLTGRFYEITQDLNRENLYSQANLKKAVEEWEARKMELEKHNIKYYKAFWPDKYYIYDEYMPSGMKIANKKGQWRCDQAIEYLNKKKSIVQIIDVRQKLIEHKKKFNVHYKQDSHWNNYGAFIGYSELINCISKDFTKIKPLCLNDFNIIWGERKYGDLSEILNLKLTDIDVNFIKKNGNTTFENCSIDGYPAKTKIYTNPKNPNGPVVLIYRDSYTNAMIPFLMEHFSKAVFIWDTPYSLDLVKKVNPNIVIECYALRYFR
jgi:hypothetical protein